MLHNNLFSARHGYHDAIEAKGTARQAASDATDALSQIESLKQDVEKLHMVTEALWTLLKEQHGYDDETLIAKVNEIDLRDGVLDGKVAKRGGATCPSCKRKLSPKHRRCIYCGSPVEQDLFGR